MTTRSSRTYRTLAYGCLRQVVKAILILGALWLFLGALVWFLPWTLIFLVAVALVWYFVRTGQGKRFTLRGLLVLTTGFAMIAAIASFVPDYMAGGSGGVPTKQIVIRVLDKTTNMPISGAEVVLTSRAAHQSTTQRITTDASGIAEFTCEVGGGITHSILRTWTTYRTGGWSIEAKAPGYRTAEKVLSDITVEGGSGGPIKFHVELEPLEPLEPNE